MPNRIVHTVEGLRDQCVIDKDGCWIWERARSISGYGVIKAFGSVIRAHRYMWEIVNGPIPKHHIICHSCDKTLCINPDHLWLGTHKSNSDDKIRKGRGGWLKGSDCAKSKFTWHEIREARRLLKEGVPFSAVIKILEIPRSTLSDIKLGKTWKEIYPH